MEIVLNQNVIFLLGITMCFFLDFRSRSHFRGPGKQLGDRSHDLVTSKAISRLAFLTSARTVRNNV